MRRIGLDFDNTIICYDDVFLGAAQARHLLPETFRGNKQAVRDAIRLTMDGEISWQKLQGHVYGRGIGGARAFPGVHAFLRRARSSGSTVVIVSHKTRYGHFDAERVDLRDAALGWMCGQGFFDRDGLGVAPENVFFADTRKDKLRRIAEVGCDVFIDDLEEVLSDSDFPPTIERILFSSPSAETRWLPYKVCDDWAAIEDAVFS